MTPEARFDRLERIVKLMIKAGLRARRQGREQDERINILIAVHEKNEERLTRLSAESNQRSAQIEERLARLAAESNQKSAQIENRLARLAEDTNHKFAQVAEFQARTDRKLAELMDWIRKGRNGNPSQNN